MSGEEFKTGGKLLGSGQRACMGAPESSLSHRVPQQHPGLPSSLHTRCPQAHLQRRFDSLALGCSFASSLTLECGDELMEPDGVTQGRATLRLTTTLRTAGRCIPSPVQAENPSPVLTPCSTLTVSRQFWVARPSALLLFHLDMFSPLVSITLASL